MKLRIARKIADRTRRLRLAVGCDYRYHRRSYSDELLHRAHRRLERHGACRGRDVGRLMELANALWAWNAACGKPGCINPRRPLFAHCWGAATPDPT